MAMAERRPEHSCVKRVHAVEEMSYDGPAVASSCGTSLTEEAICHLCESSTESDWQSNPDTQQQETHISLLELAAGNDLEALKKAVDGGASLEEPENWYTRLFGKNQMAIEQRTPLMVASLYGSVEVLSYILSSIPCPVALVNKSWGADETTALHCAAAGGADRTVDAMKLLLDHGASVNVKDVHGRRPVDVLVVPLKLLPMKASIEDMLNNWPTSGQNSRANIPSSCDGRLKKGIEGLKFISDSPSLPDDECFDLFSPEFVDKSYNLTNTFLSLSCGDSSSRISSPSPSSPKFVDDDPPVFSGEKQRDFPVDASLPDIKNSIYTTDEFRMFSFKIRPCSRAYSHDWTECPFVHPGENARRRDPRRYHYSCVPCPDFRKGACRRGDACEYAHGVFECWLHPAQYRTRLCKDGTNCGRRVCFFAHTTEELRPLFISMGSTVPSPRDARSMSPPLPPGSPAQVLLAPPFSPSNPSVNTPPLSPSGSPMHSSVGGGWSQPNIPSLHLPGGSLHMSRLRAALNARDIPIEDLNDRCDFEPCLESQFSPLPIHNRQSPVSIRNAGGKLGKYGNLGLSIPPTNLHDIFASEVGSPLAMNHSSYVQEHNNYVHELSHLSPQFQNQLPSQISSMLSPRSPQRSQLQSLGKHQTTLPSPTHSPLLNIISPLHDSTRLTEFDILASISPGSHESAAISRSKKAAFALRGRESWSSKDLSGSGSLSSWSDWGSPSGKPDWGVQGQDLHKLRKSASFASHGPMEPEVTWVQTLVKDGMDDPDGPRLIASGGEAGEGRRENMEHLLSSWVDQLPKDKMII